MTPDQQKRHVTAAKAAVSIGSAHIPTSGVATGTGRVIKSARHVGRPTREMQLGHLSARSSLPGWRTVSLQEAEAETTSYSATECIDPPPESVVDVHRT